MPLHSLYYSLLLCGLIIMSLAFSLKKAAVATPTRGCSEVERDALLDFKANVKDPSHRLASWSPQIDCCKWSGVVCKTTNNATLFGGHRVVELNLQNPNVDNEQIFHTALRGEILSPSLLNLTRLERLNPSGNDFEGAQIPQFIGSFLNLKYLELSWSNFSGVTPSQLGNLTSFYHLGLQSTGWYATPIAHHLDWLSGLSSLRYLDLTQVNLSAVSQNWSSEVNMLPSLQELYLYGCDLNHIPSSFNSHLNLTSLEILDLEANPFYSSSSSLPNWLWRLTNLSLLRIDASGLIPAGMSNLTRLIQLHISGNVSSPLPVEIWSLNHLILLDLSNNKMLTDPIPAEIANLSSLQSLFLYECSINDQIPSEMGNLNNLTTLDLSFNSLSGPIPTEIGNLTSLINLDLSFNSLSGPIPTEIGNLTSLINLDLSSNSFLGIPTEIGSLTNLISLYLSSNSLSGPIPIEIGKLSKLQVLFLSNCSLNGQIPSEIGNLTSLIRLDLYYNSLSGPIPTEIGKLSKLQVLFLYNCSLNGQIPSEIGNLTSLMRLDLSYNSLSSPRKLSKLQYLFLLNCLLNGQIPFEIGNLTSLISLDLSYNSLSGPIPIEIGKLSNLKDLYLRENSRITISLDYDSIPSFQLESLDLASCTAVGPWFPQWLHSQKSMSELSLSNTSINDILPHWFWNSSSSTFLYIDLSHNKLRGTLPSSIEVIPSINNINLRNNCWTPSSYLILSNNHFNGCIPSFICKSEQLEGLDLSYNKLSGEIPKCWQEANTNLYFIHLGNNKLTGEIPSSIGNLIGLESLHLDNNDLSGQLPMSLQNYSKLHVIDLTGNNFLGRIPMWMGQSLQQLTILILRSNMFSGIIPSNLGELSNLHVLDLANNNFGGSIPYSFGNFNAIRLTSRATDDTISIEGSISIRVSAEYFEFGESDSVSIVTKGYKYRFSSILYLVKIIDLSSNNLTGEFPTTLGSLVGLQTLNLSRNFLKGWIPDTIGGMKSLETLDLSFNNLSGVIPQDLLRLNALDHLNLSYNNLSGDIPSGFQLQTLLDASIYMGNAYLCGDLINKSCSNDVDNDVTKEELQKRKDASPLVNNMENKEKKTDAVQTNITET
ncbi:receptor-like protein EIX1 [Zingiber officinale]|uniref:receptor-like protein EIX1 n=1 Tax=Zingiber officinale TaxID=94328 RepID=UPI001C4D8FCE|nr:receptor-like protein EIX1 [Zingiber officinale]